MKTPFSLCRLLAFVLLVSAAREAWAEDAPASTAKRHSLERLYSLPSLIGTAPTGFSWSSDSRRLAFLWNDSGLPFRDIWLVDATDPELEPERLTDLQTLPHSEPIARPVDQEGALAEALEREVAERNSGVKRLEWTPDGRRVIFGFRGDLWSLQLGSGPIQLTATEAVESAASVSPDGTRIAYLLSGELWTLPIDDSSRERTPKRRTSNAAPDQAAVSNQPVVSDQDILPLDTRITDFRWSPDSSRIALLHEDRREVKVRGIPDYLAPETTLKEVRRAYPGENAVRQKLGILDPRNDSIDWIEWPSNAPDKLLSYRWSPDGSHLAIDTSDLYAKDRQIFVIDLKDGKATQPRRIARDLDPQNETFYFWRIEWAADSTAVYFLSDRSEDYHLYAVSPSGGEPTQLTRGGWAVASMTAIPDGLIAVGNLGRAEERQLFHVPRATGEPRRLSKRAGTHSPVVSPNGKLAAVAISSDGSPPDLFLTELSGSQRERRITESPIEEFAEYPWVTPQYVEFTSHIDGSPLHGRLTLPPDWEPGKTYPAILGSVYTQSVRNQWGGRTAHPTWGLDQFLAQEGYVLLNVDMRGSWGRGREHRRGIRLDYGGMDIEDLESGVRFLETLGYVDMDRIGIWGSSYGGLMTTMSLFRKPELYAAGVAGAPATNVWHALTGQMAVMMHPQDQAGEYADSSPFLHSSGLDDPLMIIHGMRDLVVLYKDSVVLTQRLIQQGKDVELVTLPNGGHGWDNEGLAQTRYAFRKLFQHFERHLKEKSSTTDQ